MHTIDFYFDYISPYAYLGHHRLLRWASSRDDVQVKPRPVLFPALLNHWGQLGPAEVPPKRDFVFRDVVRNGVLEQIPIGAPASHPFNPLLALRLSLASNCGEHHAAVISALWTATWVDGVDVSDPEAVRTMLDLAGLPADQLLAGATSQAAKAELKAQTARAVEIGVFGVPTLVCGDELFWGSDQLIHVERFLDGKDPVDDTIRSFFADLQSSAARK